jgi:iron complex transport system substrate-binding protein
LVLVACAEQTPETGAPSATGGAPAAATRDDGTPHRIVAFTCGAVDVLTLFGELERVIAVEEDCPAPGTEGMVKVRNDDHPGQVQVVHVEALAALAPDLVIAKDDLKDAFAGRGLRMLWSPTVVDLETLPGFVLDVARTLGVEQRGHALLGHMDQVRAELTALTLDRPRVRVYYEVNGPGRTVGQRSIVDDMIRLAGGENIAGAEPRPNVQLTTEAILAADPEVIVLGAFAPSVEEVCARPGWQRLSAVKHGRVHHITPETRYTMLGTPRCVDGCREFLLPWFHPELVESAPRR